VEELKKRNVSATLVNFVVTRMYTGPWTLCYVRFDDGTLGCGISNNETKVPSNLSFIKDLLGLDAYEAIRKLKNTDKNTFVNSLIISITSALSSRLLKEEVLGEEGYMVKVSYVPDLSALDLRRYIRETDTVAMVGFHVMLTSQIANIAKKVNVTELMDLKDLEVTDFAPEEYNVQIFPAYKNEEVLENADVVIITGETIVNETIEDLLKFSRNARARIVYGPTCSFYPKVLFKEGVDVLSTVVIPTSPQFKRQFILSRGWWQGIKGVKFMSISKGGCM